jgi:hypothetical protein
MNTRCKIFDAPSCDRAEHKINEWLNMNEGIEITHTNHVLSSGGYSKISIFYKIPTPTNK